MRRLLQCLAIALFSFNLCACHHQAPPAPAAIDYRRELPAGMVALRKISPGEYPNFGAEPIDPVLLSAAINNSLKYLSTPSSQAFFPYLDITHDRAVATLKRLSQLCREVQSRGAWDPAWFNAAIARDFEVYQSIGAPSPDGAGYTDRVLFTGYFTPIYDASMARTPEYRWPLYKLPKDVARDPATGEVHGRLLPGGQVTPYYTRGEIETGGKLAGDELVWLKSRWEAYIITIQGSARLRLIHSGQIYEVGFAGTNGYPYSSPGQQMLADGAITKEQYSLKGLGEYFDAHPDAMDKYLAINQRYIFFTERPGGPFGSLNVPVTPLATIATDKQAKDIYPRAMPAFVVVPIPTETGAMRPFSHFLMDQDTGGAIRASGRCDIYMGVGPQAQTLAGHELQEGTLYYLAVKPELLSNPAPIVPQELTPDIK